MRRRRRKRRRRRIGRRRRSKRRRRIRRRRRRRIGKRKDGPVVSSEYVAGGFLCTICTFLRGKVKHSFKNMFCTVHCNVQQSHNGRQQNALLLN